MNDIENTQAVIDTATRAAEPTVLDRTERFHSVVVPAGGTLEVIDLEKQLDRYRERPRRKQGTFRVHDAESFVSYLGKHGLPESEVWADVTTSNLIAVVNAHATEAILDEPGADAVDADQGAGWADHRVEYAVRPTQAWTTWLSSDGKLLDQNSFAELIEDRAVDIVAPAAADMLELAQTFQATIGVSFESSKLLSSGQRQLEYKETVDSRAGHRGRLEIPKEFTLGLVPFEGADPYKVTARFRYRITDGQLRIGYRLERPQDVMREAFLGVVDKVSEAVSQPVYRGVSA